MATQNETGHVRNLANFNRLIDLCTLFAARYNPSNPNIQLSALQRQHQNAERLFADVINIKTTYQTTVIARQDAFQQAEALPARILSVLKSNETNPKLVQIAQNLTKKLRGQRIGKLKKEDEDKKEEEKETEETNPETTTPTADAPVVTPDPADTTETDTETIDKTETTDKDKKDAKKRSVSQRSYDQRVSHFNQLYAVIQSAPTYLTNETDLQLSTLRTTIDNLHTLNQDISNAEYTLQRQRNARQESLYAPTTGLIDLAFMVKEYIKSVFGTKSTEYKSITALKFVRR